MSAFIQYIPLKNEYILHPQLNIYCIRGIYTASAYEYILHRQTQYYCIFNSVELANCGHSLYFKVSENLIASSTKKQYKTKKIFRAFHTLPFFLHKYQGFCIIFHVAVCWKTLLLHYKHIDNIKY